MQEPTTPEGTLPQMAAGRNRLKRERKAQRALQLKTEVEALKKELTEVRSCVKEISSDTSATCAAASKQLLPPKSQNPNSVLMNTIEELSGSLRERKSEYEHDRSEWKKASETYEQTTIPAKDREIQELMDQGKTSRVEFNHRLSDLQFTVDAKCVEIEQLKENILHLDSTLADLFANLRPICKDDVLRPPPPDTVQTRIHFLESLQSRLKEYQMELEEKNHKLEIYEAKIKLMEFQNRRLKEQIKEYEDNVELFKNAFKTVDELKDIIKNLEVRIRTENDQLEQKIKELYGNPNSPKPPSGAIWQAKEMNSLFDAELKSKTDADWLKDKASASPRSAMSPISDESDEHTSLETSTAPETSPAPTEEEEGETLKQPKRTASEEEGCETMKPAEEEAKEKEEEEKKPGLVKQREEAASKPPEKSDNPESRFPQMFEKAKPFGKARTYYSESPAESEPDEPSSGENPPSGSSAPTEAKRGAV